MTRCAELCCATLCSVAVLCVVMCCTVRCSVVLRCSVLRSVGLCNTALCCALPCCAVPYHSPIALTPLNDTVIEFIQFELEGHYGKCNQVILKPSSSHAILISVVHTPELRLTRFNWIGLASLLDSFHVVHGSNNVTECLLFVSA